ncbi:MAG: DUF3052 domain-containing protein [Dehalococcoidia bacterium]|nr:DUF3052 domain-containing protein [Dehalococcoidia bacterium]
MAGYSGTPLPRKLGIAPGALLALIEAPAGFAATLGALPEQVTTRTALRGGADVALCFVTERRALERRIEALGRAIFPAGAAWIAWPKRAARVPTDMTEEVVRAVALPLGLVDTKVCAIDETWSALRLVWRRERRAGPEARGAR